MNKILGVIRLAPGEVGYFDDLTRIHLTISSPERAIVAGMNTTNIKRSVASGRLLLVSGSLEPVAAQEHEKPVVDQKAEVNISIEEAKKAAIEAERDKAEQLIREQLAKEKEIDIEKVAQEKPAKEAIEEIAAEEVVVEKAESELVAEVAEAAEAEVATAEEAAEQMSNSKKDAGQAPYKKGSHKKKK